MNWKLILQLSLFGLAMGLATVFFISSNVEPFCWLVIFLVSAYMIATRAPGRYFLHGLCVGIANSVWVTASHVALVNAYFAHHPKEVAMMATMPLATHPRLMMALTGPVIGVLSGLVLGVLAIVASRMVKRTPSRPTSTTA
jgi:Ash protein family